MLAFHLTADGSHKLFSNHPLFWSPKESNRRSAFPVNLWQILFKDISVSTNGVAHPDYKASEANKKKKIKIKTTMQTRPVEVHLAKLK